MTCGEIWADSTSNAADCGIVRVVVVQRRRTRLSSNCVAKFYRLLVSEQLYWVVDRRRWRCCVKYSRVAWMASTSWSLLHASCKLGRDGLTWSVAIHAYVITVTNLWRQSDSKYLCKQSGTQKHVRCQGWIHIWSCNQEKVRQFCSLIILLPKLAFSEVKVAFSESKPPCGLQSSLMPKIIRERVLSHLVTITI